MFCSLGNYGAVFLPGAYQMKEAVIFASRPGLRLWKANVNGNVQATYLFKDLLQKSKEGIELLSSLVPKRRATKGRDYSFGPLMIFDETLLVTHDQDTLFVIDPGLGTFVGYLTEVGPILDLVVYRDEILILRNTEALNQKVLKLSRRHVSQSSSGNCLI